MVSLPVFLQAPWVRFAPASSALFTGVLLLLGLVLERQAQERWSQAGALLVGFSGSWLAGSLFWGWCRLHPLWHLPIEAFALPLALTGLAGRWRLACAFYLGSLLGTAATDAVMALTGVMAHWTIVLQASPDQAPLLLHTAARQVLQPLALCGVLLAAVAIGLVCRQIWQRGTACRVAASSLLTTLVVDGLFLLAALLAPHLSGLV
ncbi:DUF3120 domain-containing protein [Synechococcus sp. CS-1328]|nr:DUF3120 domain-containing protein [Synechococcus sp. CS-1328]